MRRLLRYTLPLALTLSGNACAWRRPTSDAGALPAPIMLRVDNKYRTDVTILVLAEGQTTKLGTVTAASAASMLFPEHLSGRSFDLRLVADPLGSSSRFTSDVVYVRPGSRLTWTLESDLRRSTLAVYE